MKLTRNQLFEWAKRQTQWTDNDLLNPHNPDVADSEMVTVLPWTNFVSIIYRITEGRIEIIDEEDADG